MTKKHRAPQKEKWKVTMNSHYHMDREQRLSIAFEQLVPEKGVLLASRETESENEISKNSALCSGIK
jgi:hypothetical protein